MTANINTDRLKRRLAARLAASAAAAFLLSGVSALAQTAPQAAPPSYQVYRSHIQWNNDCVAGPSVRPGQPQYRIYKSHIAWRNDAVAADGAGVDRPNSQQWELFQSHVDHYDTCSLHPILMSTPVPSYSWGDVENLIAGTAGRQG